MGRHVVSILRASMDGGRAGLEALADINRLLPSSKLLYFSVFAGFKLSNRLPHLYQLLRGRHRPLRLSELLSEFRNRQVGRELSFCVAVRARDRQQNRRRCWFRYRSFASIRHFLDLTRPVPSAPKGSTQRS